MKLRQTLEQPISGYWDGGKKQTFEWEIEKYHGGKDSRGYFVRIGCWSANHWFHVSLGKTEKLTLSYAKKHLRAVSPKCKFDYVEG